MSTRSLLDPVAPEAPELPPETPGPSTSGGAPGQRSGPDEPRLERSWPVRRPPRAIVRLAIRFYGVALLVAVVWRMGLRGESLLYADAEAAARGVDWLRDGGSGLAIGLGVVLLSDLITRSTSWGEALARTLGETLGPLRLRDCLLLAGLSGVAEEAFFRGAMQPELGLVATSLVFGLAHLVPRRELLPWTAFTVVAGFVLGGLYAWTGNLVAPVVMHTVVNGVNLRRLTRDLARSLSARRHRFFLPPGSRNWVALCSAKWGRSRPRWYLPVDVTGMSSPNTTVFGAFANGSFSRHATRIASASDRRARLELHVGADLLAVPVVLEAHGERRASRPGCRSAPRRSRTARGSRRRG